MSLIRVRLAVVVLWLLSLVTVGALVHAQVRPETRQPPADATVFSGADVGFQAYDAGGRTVIGKLVVRVNGHWKDAEFAPVRRIQPLTIK
jgi:hypothetical protein